MTIETNHVIALGDLATMAMQCNTCLTNISWELQRRQAVPEKCPSCNGPLAAPGSDLRNALSSFLESYRSLDSALRQPGCPTRLTLTMQSDERQDLTT